MDIKILVAAHKKSGYLQMMCICLFMWGRRGKRLWGILRIIRETIFPLKIRITVN